MVSAAELLESMVGHVIEAYEHSNGVLSFQLENGLTYHLEYSDDGIKVSATGVLPN